MEEININGFEYSVPQNPSNLHTNAGRFVLIAQESTNTFDQQDVDDMAKNGILILAVPFGQNVYKFVKENEKQT